MLSLFLTHGHHFSFVTNTSLKNHLSHTRSLSIKSRSNKGGPIGLQESITFSLPTPTSRTQVSNKIKNYIFSFSCHFRPKCLQGDIVLKLPSNKFMFVTCLWSRSSSKGSSKSRQPLALVSSRFLQPNTKLLVSSYLLCFTSFTSFQNRREVA